MDSGKLKAWWASLGIDAPEAEAVADDADDFADMGTAFGLDASLSPAGAPAGEAGRPVTRSPQAD